MEALMPTPQKPAETWKMRMMGIRLTRLVVVMGGGEEAEVQLVAAVDGRAGGRSGRETGRVVVMTETKTRRRRCCLQVHIWQGF